MSHQAQPVTDRRPNDVRAAGSDPVALAPVDRAILAVLRENARLPNNAIAARVGVAPSTCLARIRSLEERGVILGYHTDIDPTVTGGAIQAMIAVRLRAGARDRLQVPVLHLYAGTSELG